MTHAVIDSPLGPLTAVTENGFLAGLFMADQRHRPDSSRFGPRDDSALPELRDQLAAYWAGDLTHFTVPLALRGTPFQQQVWAALQRVPYGTTCTYAELAAAIGRPTAVRAVGAANGRNPVCLVVPCHRVVGSGGALTGYAGGLVRKQLLVQHELTHSALLLG
ncbi:MAG: methylated-DNA--[protein]-cysteine S-methyltransferase [Frankiales bacterium]|nr:methylated-DNA--[protein]-cysteine S-methyltransferase [Frankiales bacterium]